MSTQSPLLLATGDITFFMLVVCSMSLQQWHTPSCPRLQPRFLPVKSFSSIFPAPLYLCPICMKLQISSSVHLYSTPETPGDKSKCTDYTSQRKEPKKTKTKPLTVFVSSLESLMFWFIIRPHVARVSPALCSAPTDQTQQIPLSPSKINNSNESVQSVQQVRKNKTP